MKYDVTGIPIEALFGAIGALGMAVYASMIYEIRKLRASAEERARIQEKVHLAVRMICAKLDIKGVFDHD